MAVFLNAVHLLEWAGEKCLADCMGETVVDNCENTKQKKREEAVNWLEVKDIGVQHLCLESAAVQMYRFVALEECLFAPLV